MAGKILSTIRIFDKFIKIDELLVTTKQGGSVLRECMTVDNAVGALVYNTSTERFIFVKQWRPGPRSEIIEIPAGMMDIVGESAENCIIREIQEETGYKVDLIKELCPTYYVSVGYSDAKMTIFYCEVSEKISEGGGCDSEEIEIVEMDIHEFNSFVPSDAKTIMALNAFRTKK